MSPRSSIFVLGHEQRRLDALSQVDGLVPVNLNDLDLPERLRGQDLAEARFVVSPGLLDGCDSEWIGIVSARWEEKWPAWPGLADLPRLAAHLRDPRMVVAPAVWWWPRGDVARFSQRQDLRYPGMGALLDDPGAPSARPITSTPGLLPLVFNNTFIAHRSVVMDWLAFLRASFTHYDSLHGLDLPFEVECAWCGELLRDQDGNRTRHPGRLYDPARHAGYFYEVLTAKFFLSRDIVVVDAHGRPRAPNRVRSLANSWYWRAGGARSAAQRLHGPCTANHRRAS